MRGKATVVKNAGSHFLLSRLPEWAPFPAVLKGKIRLSGSEATNPVAVGDVVTYEYSEEPSLTHPASIMEVVDRKNYVIRKSTNLSRHRSQSGQGLHRCDPLFPGNQAPIFGQDSSYLRSIWHSRDDYSE